MYRILFTKFNQEGDGIWARFNWMVGLNLSFFAAFGYVWLVAPVKHHYWREICLTLSTGGLIITSWSMYVLDRLWKWHQHWREQLKIIEGAFPEEPGWVRPHWDSSKWISFEPGLKRWIPGYTQLFHWLFFVGWALGFAAVWTST